MEQGQVWVTPKGKKILETRRDELIAQRETAANNVREAREFGDLKENAEYAAAREAQANLEDEISSINEKLDNLRMFSYSKVDTSSVHIGAKVEIAEINGKKETKSWIITGVIENDPANFYISNEAPLGKSLLGKKVGDVIELHTPSGVHKYRVNKIQAGA
jgi:transcription elongation factor GreA